MSTFDHDKLISYVENVNPRTEKHGDNDALAVDVLIRVTKAENTEVWPELIDELVDELEPEHAMRNLDELAGGIKSVKFIAEAGQHKANFWQGNRKPASLTEAKVNNFIWRCEKGSHSLSLRIQAGANGDQTGALCELLGQKVRLELVSTQQDLPLEGGGEDSDDDRDDDSES